MNNKEIMAKNIKKYMDRKGISNQKICADLGFKYTTFLDWIKGVTYPRIGKVEAMADYFGCEKSDLIEDKESNQTISTDAKSSMDELQKALMSQDAILFDGEPIDDETRDLLLISLRNTMELAEKLSKNRKG